ncbi:MAG: tetratricopeptide repeat protein, partial [Thermoanaerobaculia bacterium]|nr:tetratricopeptide repeat protein [Thermoanaerobaculia bacterium]
HELQGEVLLSLERWDEAIAAFEGSLARTPNRALSLRGLARALRGSGDEEGARDAYRRLAKVWEGRTDAPGIEEAQDFLAAGG